MFSRILGIIWIILGVLWTVKPAVLRRRLIKKTNRKIRWAVYGLIVALAFSLIGVVLKAQGLALKLAGLIGIVATVRTTLFFTAEAQAKVTDWGTKQSLLIFRIWGAVILVIGLFLFFITEKSLVDITF